MFIVHCIYDDPKNPWCGGGGALRAKKINEIIASDHKIIVVTGNYPGARNETINQVEYRRVGWSASYLLSRLSYTFFVPWFIMRKKCDLIVNDVSFFSPSFANFFSSAPCVSIIHHIMEKHALKLYFFVGFIPYFVEKIILKSVDWIITPSLSLKQKLEEITNGTRIENIANGIDNKFLTVMVSESQFILFLGRIDFYMKGLDNLIAAFAGQSANPHLHLVIAGSGKKADMYKLEQLIKRYDLESRVEVLGRVSEERKVELLAKCLFFVMPSRFEGWGIAAVEANAVGKPVLATRISGITEAVAEGKTALLVDVDNVSEMVGAMERLICDEPLRIRLGKAGREYARKFRWRMIAEKQLDFYLECKARGQISKNGP
ncbi:MAG: glycosyltransferase family 4 protein [Desulfobulbaceae bacterium]|nr:glycosyltransferase family 4 protein [Desulfobulbaceae bacterium]